LFSPNQSTCNREAFSSTLRLALVRREFLTTAGSVLRFYLKYRLSIMNSDHVELPSYNYFATAPPAETVLNQSPPRQPYTQVPESSPTTPMSPQQSVVITIQNPVPVNTVVCPSCQKPILVLHKQHRTGRTYCFSALLCFFL